MTERSPIPADLTQRDAAVRARALEASQAALREIAIQQTTDEMSHDDGRHGDLEGAYNTVIDTARCALILSPVWPPAHAPDEAKSRVIGSVIDGTNAQAGVHQVTTHETGGVTDPIPGANDEEFSGPFTSAIFNKADAARNAALREDVNDHISALGDAFDVVREETLKEQAANRAELVAALRGAIEHWSHISDEELQEESLANNTRAKALLAARAVLARATS